MNGHLEGEPQPYPYGTTTITMGLLTTYLRPRTILQVKVSNIYRENGGTLGMECPQRRSPLKGDPRTQ